LKTEAIAKVPLSGIEIECFKFKVSCLKFQVPGTGFQTPDPRFLTHLLTFSLSLSPYYSSPLSCPEK